MRPISGTLHCKLRYQQYLWRKRSRIALWRHAAKRERESGLAFK